MFLFFPRKKKRKEETEIKNNADTLLYQTEKTIKDLDTDSFKEYFRGLYLTTDFGSGAIVTVDHTYLYVHFNYLDKKGFAVLKTLDAIATKHKSHPSTVALAWQLAQPTITASIVSATSKKQLQTLIDAPDLNLDIEDLESLNGL